MMTNNWKVGETRGTMTKVQDAPQPGVYVPTKVDERKAEADFLLKQVCPNYIRWKDGRGETVSDRKLEKLKAEHPNWQTDF